TTLVAKFGASFHGMTLSTGDATSAKCCATFRAELPVKREMVEIAIRHINPPALTLLQSPRNVE
ncbi:MAG: hypothetical protein RLZZ131_954, partial [Actinomycetota bacterium]